MLALVAVLIVVHLLPLPIAAEPSAKVTFVLCVELLWRFWFGSI
ncbi:hypothetical protein GLA29479_1826 [Lysobacter antibioticus]|nr:hypothetical protein GLA29479_1826 [Lysobacter antibioticus]